MSKQYILEGNTPVKCDDLIKWGDWMSDFSSRVVAKDSKSGIDISTVFLGVDYSYEGGPPLLFETMIFGGDNDQELWRCSTWDEAIVQHIRALELIEDTP